MTTTNSESTFDLHDRAVVALDALQLGREVEARELLAPVLERARTHGEAEGRADHDARQDDVDSGQQSASWVWPFVDADDAYLGAVGSSGICKEIGIPVEAWDEIASSWLTAFRAGYGAAHAEAVAGRKVMSYDSGERLTGVPSEALAEASDTETSGTGAVLAYRDGDGIWQHVPDHQESFFRDVRGEDVVTVYVEAE